MTSPVSVSPYSGTPSLRRPTFRATERFRSGGLGARASGPLVRNDGTLRGSLGVAFCGSRSAPGDGGVFLAGNAFAAAYPSPQGKDKKHLLVSRRRPPPDPNFSQMVRTRAMNVLVYSGDGVSSTSVEHARASLRALLAHRYDVMIVDANVLRSEPWTEQCALLVFPGGRDLPYLRDLAGTANQRILSYVRRGGRYLGICAGAYYASARVEFELGGPLAVEGSRELAFFPGVCQGSVFPGFQYNSMVGARAAAIHVDPGALGDGDLPEEFRVYHNGGGAFVGADSLPGVTVLARYANADALFREPSGLGAASVVDCQVGSGRAILTAVHPEYIPSRLDPAEYASVDSAAPFAALFQDNPARERLLSALLARLGLETSAAVAAEDSACTPLYLTCASEALLRRVVDAWAARFVPGTTTIRDERYVFNIVEGGCCYPAGAPENEKTVIVIPAGSAPPASLTPGFDVEKYLGYLKKCQREEEANQRYDGIPGELSFGCALLYASVTESTQNFLFPTARFVVRERNTSFTESLPDGSTFVATRQLQGRGEDALFPHTTAFAEGLVVPGKTDRPTYLALFSFPWRAISLAGRGRNSWISPPGCLQFSTYFRHPLAAAPLTVFIQYIAALAVVQAVKQRPGHEDVPLALKWPNDIYAVLPEAAAGGEAKIVKIGGVLVNSTFQNDEFRLVVGQCFFLLRGGRREERLSKAFSVRFFFVVVGISPDNSAFPTPPFPPRCRRERQHVAPYFRQ
ncbi:MAG: biotin-protein ligase [Olpidium bornovanus]|uniref:Biotin-protein ligase n=1 Tax=Olpidium bornovanus TaxID=278681 RepID=A0A8H8DGH9_9FUNG|nr:MAG: biotin-protein ligase [Olpidium bornovanus]